MRSFHFASASLSEVNAFCKSGGTLCTTPVLIIFFILFVLLIIFIKGFVLEGGLRDSDDLIECNDVMFGGG